MMKNNVIAIDGKSYNISIHQQLSQSVLAPRLVVVSYLPNAQAPDILRTCLKTIQKFTPEAHELWVIDNHSPRIHSAWLSRWPGINVVFNFTEPVPPENRSLLKRLFQKQSKWGSYANAIALEIATRVIDPDTRYFMSLHMDTMTCRNGWLSFLMSKIDNHIAAAGVRMDRARTPAGVLHVLGLLVDYQKLKYLNLNYFPQLPKFDTGDLITIGLRKNGYDVYACTNTLWQPELINKIPESSPLRHFDVDRSFDDDNNIIFLHLGRGVGKTLHSTMHGVTAKAWVKFAEDYFCA